MQERYLGDIHDFFKINFLEFSSQFLKEIIGLNWYFVKPESISKTEIKKNDGEKRNYLYKSEYLDVNNNLISEFRNYKNPRHRSIEIFTNNARFKKIIKFYNEPILKEKRKEWFKRSISFFKDTKVIFLDPDNGISFNKSGKSALKYVSTDELLEYYNLNKIIIFTQFQSFNKVYKKHLLDIISKLNQLGIKHKYPIIRNRSGPNTFFITLSKIKELKIYDCLNEYSKSFDKVDLINF